MDVKRFFIQASDMLLRKKYRDIEYRRFIRLKDSLSLGMRLIDCKSGKIYSKQIRGVTLNISLEGLCIETNTVTVNGVDIFNDAMSDEKNLELEIDVLNKKEKIRALGKVVWLDMTPKDKSFLFKAGVYLNLNWSGDNEKWYELVENAKKYSKNKPWIIRQIQNIFK
jgi:hypothetical protein